MVDQTFATERLQRYAADEVAYARHIGVKH
jgi:hypothetical protein